MYKNIDNIEVGSALKLPQVIPTASHVLSSHPHNIIVGLFFE